jgi:hypothetical protein
VGRIANPSLSAGRIGNPSYGARPDGFDKASGSPKALPALKKFSQDRTSGKAYNAPSPALWEKQP